MPPPRPSTRVSTCASTGANWTRWCSLLRRRSETQGRQTALKLQCSAGIRELGSQDFNDLAAEDGDFEGRRPPNFIPGDTEVVMHHAIAHALRLGPRNQGVAFAQIAGHTR